MSEATRNIADASPPAGISQPDENAAYLLAAIVDSSDDAIVSKDLDGIITSWNKGAERVFGYTAAEAIGRSILLIIPPDRQQEEPEILARIRRGLRVDHFETVRRRKDGVLIDISVTISPVRDGKGRIVGASKIARDITDRKRAERAIETLNEQLAVHLAATTRLQDLSTRLLGSDLRDSQFLAEILDAALEVTRTDRGSLQLIEDGALKIVAQRGHRQAFLRHFSSVHGGQAACGTALATGRRVIVPDVTESPLFVGTPGLQVMLDADIRGVHATPLISRAGQVVGILSVHHRAPHQPGDRDLRLLDVLARQAADLIENRRAAAALMASEARFRQLTDSMPQMVWTAQPDGQVDYYNERVYEFTGFPRNSFSSTIWDGILHPDDYAHTNEAWHRALQTGAPLEVELRLWDAHQLRWKWFMTRALPVRSDKGQICRWFGTITDISEQKRVEDDLRRANQDLEQFAYSASHDLQEPLRGVRIYSQLLSRRYADKLDGQARDYLHHLNTGAARAEMLVRDLLAYTQVAKLDDVAEPVQAGEVLADALTTLAPVVEETRASITHDALPAVPIQRAHLLQLFQNLLSNALKYRDPNRSPVIHISAEEQNGTWTFAVEDNGIGIDPQYQEVIFGLFKRLHASDEYSGTGLGLAICRRILERYRGKIWVESAAGQGATFRFSVPGHAEPG